MATRSYRPRTSGPVWSGRVANNLGHLRPYLPSADDADPEIDFSPSHVYATGFKTGVPGLAYLCCLCLAALLAASCASVRVCLLHTVAAVASVDLNCTSMSTPGLAAGSPAPRLPHPAPGSSTVCIVLNRATCTFPALSLGPRAVCFRGVIFIMFGRKKKKKKKAGEPSASAEAEKRAASKENVRVRHRGSEEENGHGAPSEGEDEDQSNADFVVDRRAMKAAASATQAGKGAGTELGRGEKRASEGDNKSGDDEEVSLRKGRYYGDAKETPGGFYLLDVRVENWTFCVDDVTVPVGTVVRFSVDEREKPMVEVTVLVKDESDNVVSQSPALSAGQQWEWLCTTSGSFTFEDLEDADLGGDIEVVPGDQQARFGMHVAKKREKDALQERDAARRKTELDANKRFEAEFLEREAEKRAADADFAAATVDAGNEPSDGNSVSLESNLDENHQQAIEDSLKLYQEAVAQRRKYM